MFFNLEKAFQSLNFKHLIKPIFSFINKEFNIVLLLLHNLREKVQSTLPRRLVKPAIRLINLEMPLKLGKAFRSLNSKNLVKPIVLFLSIILIISTVSLLATVVQGDSENKTTISINTFSTNSTNPTPTPKPTATSAITTNLIRTFSPPLTLPIIPNPTPDSSAMPTPTSPIPSIPSSTPEPIVIPTTTFPPDPTPTSTPYPTIIITTPTPNPTMTPLVASPQNLAPIPHGWSTATNGMLLAIGGVSNNVLDYNVLYDGNPTIRQDPVGSTNNYAREVDGPALGIKPGDTITFSCWIKTSASSYGDQNPSNGARIGIDFYSNSQTMTGTTSTDGSVWTPSGGWANNQIHVPWGTNTWTKVTIHFVVPSAYPAIAGYAGNAYYSGQMVTPTAMIPWMQVQSPYDGGQGWFANPTIYINH